MDFGTSKSLFVSKTVLEKIPISDKLRKNDFFKQKILISIHIFVKKAEKSRYSSDNSA